MAGCAFFGARERSAVLRTGLVAAALGGLLGDVVSRGTVCGWPLTLTCTACGAGCGAGCGALACGGGGAAGGGVVATLRDSYSTLGLGSQPGCNSAGAAVTGGFATG